MESAPTPATGAEISLVPALASFFDIDLELETLERMLLAFAVHPRGGGCDRCWLLLWDPAGGRMTGWRESEAVADHGPLGAALLAARRTPMDPREPAVRAWSEAPDTLASPLAEAWQGARMSVAAAPPLAGPWAGAAHVAALAHEPALVRGALHRLQHLRAGVPGWLHPGRDVAESGRNAGEGALRDRLSHLHVLWALHGGLPLRGDPAGRPP